MKEYVFGFKLAAALEGNFKAAFSSASNQMLKLNEKMQQHQQIAQACASAVKQHTLRTESYNNALNKLYTNFQKVNDNARKYADIQGRINQRRSAMGQNESSIFSLDSMSYGLAAPLKQAIKFESAMSDVRKVVDFDNDDQFAQMNKDILALSKSIPMTAIAATGIKNLILTMVSGESATKSQNEAFATLGFSATDMASRMQKDAKGAILDVLKALNSLDKDKQGATLQKLFGKESIGAIAPLLSNLEGLEKNLGMVASQT